MGKPRMIILVRHAQSEGNKNRDIHQFIPDHRVKLTQNGWGQAEEAGRQLRSLLKPDDTIQFFTSPYRRTRETTEGILRTLTGDDPTPSPFARHKIKVFEEPRLREQDFGNFQPCSAEMERMWQERADYGHFFYRIPHGESAADAYDRISGFNESLWRQFGDADFPSVCVLVTHGLMTRVFLMKWYHWSVEYFEDLRNVNHCEFIVMKQKATNGKYVLENELRTWSDLKRRAAAANTSNGAPASSSPSKGLPAPGIVTASPAIPTRRWGGCADGCNHDKQNWPRRVMRKNTMEYGVSSEPVAPSAHFDGEKEDHPVAAQEADRTPPAAEASPPKLSRKASTKQAPIPSIPLTPASPNDASDDSSTSDEGLGSSTGEQASRHRTPSSSAPRTTAIMKHLQPPLRSGRPGTPGDGLSDDSDYFPGMQHAHTHSQHHNHSHAHGNGTHRKSLLRTSSRQRQESKERKAHRKMSEQSWKQESGMGSGARAEKLGDGDATSDDAALGAQRSASPTMTIQEDDKEERILPEALKGNMVVAHAERERTGGDEEAFMQDAETKVGEAEVEKMKLAERKTFDEIY